MKAMAHWATLIDRSGGASRIERSTAFAARGASSVGDGSRVPSPALSGRRPAFVLAFAAAVVGLAVAASLASADGRIGGFGEGHFLDNLAPGGLSSPLGLAVSAKEGSDIYVPDSSSPQRVDQFEPDGTFVRAFGWGIVPGSATGTGNVEAGSNLVTNVVTISGAFSMVGAGGKFITGSGIPENTRIEKVTSSELVLSKTVTTTGTAIALSVAAGPGNIPTDEQQQLTVKASAGSFKLSFINPRPGSTTLTTANISAGAPASGAGSVQEALENLSTIGAGTVSVTGGPGDATGSSPYLINFHGRYADTNVLRLSTTNVSLSGGSPSSEAGVTTPTEGGGVMETCTTVCGFPDVEEDNFERGEGTTTTRPGGLNYSDAAAIDNDPGSGSYGDVYLVDQRNFRVVKYDSEGHFLLMFGGEVNRTTHANVCTAADLSGGDICGVGIPGTGASFFYKEPSGVKSWGQDGSNSIAVGSDGTVYVGDFGRIQEFEPNGTFAGEFVLPDGEPRFVLALAVDAAGNIYERSGNINQNLELQSQVPGVRKYNSSHTLVETFDTQSGSEPTHIALDASNDLFVSDRNSGHFQFRAFKPDGTLYAVFTSDQVANNTAGIAIGDAAGKLYASSNAPEGAHIAVVPLPISGPPTVREEAVNSIQPTTATIHAVVNPKGFDTHYHFEYVDQAHFSAGGFSDPATQSTVSTGLGLINQNNPVQAAISGLHPGTVYHYRAVAESAEGTVDGPDESFESLPPVSIRDFTTQTVGPELVTFKAELNPNGSESTYTVHFGEGPGYACESGHVCSSSGNLPIGSEFEPIEPTFTGLKPNTLYHYQVVAENGYGEVETADRTFTTERSSAEERAAENCPNTNLREENSSLHLADCRAYEKTTPNAKEGGEAFSAVTLAPGGERMLYFSEGAFAGAVQNELAIPYIAHRTSAGWVTQAVLSRRVAPVGYQPVLMGTYSPELDRWLFATLPGLSAEQARVGQRTGYLSMGFADGSYLLHATPTITLEEGTPRTFYYFMQVQSTDVSDDLSHLFIVTASRDLPVAQDPRPEYGQGFSTNNTRVYEVSGADTLSPSMSVVAEVPLGLQGTGCEVDGEGAVGRQPVRRVTSDGSGLFYWAPVEVVPGANCGEGTPNPIGLFARFAGSSAVQLNAPPASQCSSPSPCSTAPKKTPLYYGASPDGARAWFTTTQPLVDSDTDTTSDLYLAKLANGQLDELVQVSAGDSTDPTPGEGAGVKGVVRISGGASHAPFVATGVLTTHENALHESAVQGANNLYVYDAQSEETKFVTRICSGPEKSGSVADPACPADLSGFEQGSENDNGLYLAGNNPSAVMTPDGRYLLFTSFGRLTSDDTDNARDLYRYDFQTGQLIRISVGRDGNDGNGNDNAFPVFIQNGGGLGGNDLAEDAERSISEDGSTIIFDTAAPLVSRDTNVGANPQCGGEGTGCDVYEWEEQGHGTCSDVGGCIGLVSDGVAPHGASSAVIGATGRDIAFQTTRDLTPEDTDGIGDVYDARVNGGFHAAHPPSPCGSPEACREAPRAESAPATLGTPNFSGPGNSAERLQCARGKVRMKRHGQVRCVTRHHKTKHHHKSKHQRASTTPGGAK